MKRPLPLLVLATASLMMMGTEASCPHNTYEIEMASADGNLLRSLTATIYSGDANDEIASLAKLYQKHEDDANSRAAVFVGAFGGRTPNDVGGSGFHAYAKSPLGNVTGYTETFRGNGDLLQQVETRMKAADRLVDMLTGWLKTEVGNEKDFDKLASFLNGDFRRDMKNLSLYAWIVTNDLIRVERSAPRYGVNLIAFAATAPASSQPTTGTTLIVASQPTAADSAQAAEAGTSELWKDPHAWGAKEVLARAIQYLLEKDYIRDQDIPLLYQLKSGNNTKAVAGTIIEKVLTRKAGVTNKTLVTKVRNIWEAGDANLEQSVRAYLRQTPEYAKLQAEWKSAAAKEPNLPQPDEMAVLSGYASEWLGLELLGPESDELRIRLACPAKPVATNGEWSGQSRSIVWSVRIPSRKSVQIARRMPTICYAVWATPDEAFQKKHFGGSVLDGESLLEYCLWCKRLSDRDRKAWDAMVEGFAPGPKLWTMLEDSRFQAGEPDPYYMGRSLLRSALAGSPATQPSSSPAGTGPDDANAVHTLTFTVTKASEHLGHATAADTHVHPFWYDGCRGRLAGSGEDIIVWWCNNAIRDTPFRFEEGKTYRLTYRGPLGGEIMGYQGPCVGIERVLKLEPIEKEAPRGGRPERGR